LIHITTSGEESLPSATDMNNLAEVYYLRGDYTHARALYEKAYALWVRLTDPDNPDSVTILTNIANTFRAQGTFGRAETLYVDALSIRKKVFGGEHPKTAMSLNDLAALHYSKGDYVRAENELLQALEIERKKLPTNHPDTLNTQVNLAEVYRSRGKLAEAEAVYEMLIPALEQSLGKQHPLLGQALHNFATVEIVLHKVSRAEALLKLSLAIRQRSVGPHHPDFAMTLNGLGVCALLRHKFGLAARLYERALSIDRGSLGANNPASGMFLSNLAFLACQRGRISAGESLFSEVVAIEEVNLGRAIAGGAEAQKQAYLDTLRGTTDAIITLSLMHPGRIAGLRLAVDALAHRKARVLEAVADETDEVRRKLPAELQATAQELKETRARLASLSMIGVGARTSADYQSEVKQLNNREDELERRLGAHFSELSPNRPLEPIDLQKSIPKRGVFIEFARFSPFNFKDPPAGPGPARYAAFVLFDGEVRGFDLGEAKAIDGLVTQLSLSIRVSANLAQTKLIARRLDARVIQPIRSALFGKTALFICPDSMLNLVSFAVLRDEHMHFLA